MHGTVEQDVVRVDGLGYRLEAVGGAREADEVGGDEPDHRDHGRAAVADFGLAEEGHEGGVGLGELEGVELEFAPLEVLPADAVRSVVVVVVIVVVSFFTSDRSVKEEEEGNGVY